MATGSKKKTAANISSYGAGLPADYPRWSIAPGAVINSSRPAAATAALLGTIAPGAGAPPNDLVVRASRDEPDEIVQKYVIWAVVGGFLPFAVVDIAFLTVVNYYMLKELSEYYGVNIDGKRAWDLVTSLFAGLIPQSFVAGAPGALVRMIPIVGSFLNGFTQAAFAGGSTYLLGHIAIDNLKAYGGSTDSAKLYADINEAAYRWGEYIQAHADDEAAA